MRLLLLLLCCWLSAGTAAEHAELARRHLYTGMAHASGAVPVTTNLFLVADDEENVLRLYRRGTGGPPVQTYDLNEFLEVSGKFLEADLEGAARIGDRAFWIGSHGRNRSGKERDNRCRLFATDIRVNGERVLLVPAGQPCKRLLEDLTADSRFEEYHLAAASLLAPKSRGALNIEGLSATPEGHLLLGFRNPLPGGKALLIPLLNPQEVIRGAPCRFGDATLLDLGGLGIRDIAFFQDTYIISAGPYDGGGPFHLYRWHGAGTRPKRIHVGSLGDFHPEAIVIYQDTGLTEFQLLSDDGRPERNAVSPSALSSEPKTFRSLWVIRKGED